MKTSNNSSNQSDFNKRFSLFLLLRRSFSFFFHRRALFAHLSVSGFDGRMEICDDVRLNKQLNEAESSDDFSSSNKTVVIERDGN